MHCRRYFFTAIEAGDPGGLFFIERFHKIYEFESSAKKDGLTAPQRLELRRTKSLPIMLEIKRA